MKQTTCASASWHLSVSRQRTRLHKHNTIDHDKRNKSSKLLNHKVLKSILLKYNIYKKVTNHTKQKYWKEHCIQTVYNTSINNSCYEFRVHDLPSTHKQFSSLHSHKHSITLSMIIATSEKGVAKVLKTCSDSIYRWNVRWVEQNFTYKHILLSSRSPMKHFSWDHTYSGTSKNTNAFFLLLQKWG